MFDILSGWRIGKASASGLVGNEKGVRQGVSAMNKRRWVWKKHLLGTFNMRGEDEHSGCCWFDLARGSSVE